MATGIIRKAGSTKERAGNLYEKRSMTGILKLVCRISIIYGHSTFALISYYFVRRERMAPRTLRTPRLTLDPHSRATQVFFPN